MSSLSPINNAQNIAECLPLLNSAREKEDSQQSVQLPPEILLHIFQFLSPATQEVAMCTCRSWKEIGEDKSLKEIRSLCFGKVKWKKYYGDIGVEPPLPENILEILESPCPYWNGKKVKESHIGPVLIPKTVNGKPLTLSTLGQFIQHPQGGGYATKYISYPNNVQEEWGDWSVPASYWALITKDILPNSRHKTYLEQQPLLKSPYTVPEALPIAVGILMHYVQTGERLYSDRSGAGTYTRYTRCQETISNKFHVVVGAFRSYGLRVRGGGICGSVFIGLGGLRKF